MLDTKGIQYQIMSFTGKSAFSVSGNTFHRSFGISQSDPYENPFKFSKQVAHRLKKTKIFFFDEFSLIGLRLMGLISQRLMGVYDNHDTFGNKSVIMFGDFSQIRPVMDRPLFTKREVLGKSDFASLEFAGKDAYDTFKNAIFLKTNMRQIEPEEETFRSLLARIRIGNITKDDIKLLSTRSVEFLSVEETNEYLEEGVALFAERKPAELYNNIRLESLNSPIIEIKSIDRGRNVPSERHVLRLAVGARVCVTRNLFVNGGVHNGAIGTCTFISNKKDEDGQPAFIMVKLDTYYGPSYMLRPDIPFVPIEYMERCKATKTSFTRKNYPLSLAYGLTCHYSQGSTLKKVLIGNPANKNSKIYSSDPKIMMQISCNKSSLFYSMAPAIFYTAISRVRKLKDVAFMQPFDEEMVNGHAHSKLLYEWQEEEERIKSLS